IERFRQNPPIGELLAELLAAKPTARPTLLLEALSLRGKNRMRRELIGLCVLAFVVCPSLADDQPQQPFWSGRLADKPKIDNPSGPKPGTDDKPAAVPNQNST